MRYIFAVLLILAGLTWGCAGSRGIEHRTSATHVSEASHPEKYTLAYSLPKTTLKLSVEASQVITRRGPYYQYAERYLGISGAPGQDETKWRISNVSIDSYQEADPDHYYILATNDRHVTNFFRLDAEGFILPVNQRQLPELAGSIIPGRADIKDPLYTDLSIHPRVVEETRTVMRMVRQDTAFVNVPVLQRQSVTKSLEAKAAEVADLIFELRSNRFKLLSGDLDLFPDGKALDVIVKEFARLEKEYLSLFTGKVFEIQHEFSFEYTPGKNVMENGTEYAILFRFSDSEGILPPNDVSGRPISLELQNEMKTNRLERITRAPASGRTDPGTLFYRIPDVAGVQLKDENRTLSSRRVLVNQYGKVVRLPADFLWE